MLLAPLPWLLLAFVALVWELLALDTGPHEPHLTISALAQTFRALNAALLLLWILAGLGYGAVTSGSVVQSSGAHTRGIVRGESASLGAVGTTRPSAHGLGLLLPHSRAVGVTFWLLLVVAAALVEGAARHSRGSLASAADFVRLISGPRIARLALIVAWAFAGWHLFAY